MPNEPMRFMVENAKLIYLNFSGRKTAFNPENSRNFCIVLDQKHAEQLDADGWNVKFPDAREDGEERDPYISVQLGYKVRPPRITMITSTGKVDLPERQVEILDSVSIAKADVICNARYWESATGSGIKAYLKTLVVTLDEDELERKYGLNESLSDRLSTETEEHSG